MADAGFEAGAKPIRLKAESAEDLSVVSALVQDAIGVTADIAWMPRHRLFAMAINRFRWEAGGAQERTQAVLQIHNAQSVRARGFDPKRRDEVFEILSLTFEPRDEVSGVLTVCCANNADFAIEVEALEIALGDVTRPWRAGATPQHPED